MENAVYWEGRQVGIECAGRIAWFSSAPPEAMQAYEPKRAEQGAASEQIAARNLSVMAGFDRQRFGE